MSCEGRFKHFCAAVGASLGATLGDGAQALVDIQEIARSRAPEKPTPVPANADLPTRMRGLSAQARETEAEAKTVALFRLMREQHGIDPPAHGKRVRDGVQVPRREATYGYAAVWDVLQAVTNHTPLPPVAEELHTVQQRKLQRAQEGQQLQTVLERHAPGIALAAHGTGDVFTLRHLTTQMRAQETLAGPLREAATAMRAALDGWERLGRSYSGPAMRESVFPEQYAALRAQTKAFGRALADRAGLATCAQCGRYLAGAGVHICPVSDVLRQHTPALRAFVAEGKRSYAAQRAISQLATMLHDSPHPPAALRAAAEVLVQARQPFAEDALGLQRDLAAAVLAEADVAQAAPEATAESKAASPTTPAPVGRPRLRGDVSGLEGDVNGLDGDVADLTGDVTHLRGDVTGLAGNASRLRGVVSRLRGDVSALSGDASQLRGDVTGLVGSVTQLEGDVSGLTGDASRLRGDVTELRGDVTGLEGDVARSLSGNVSRLRGDVTGIAGDVSGVQGNVSGVRGDCTGLTIDLDALRLTKAQRARGVNIADLAASDAATPTDKERPTL